MRSALLVSFVVTTALLPCSSTTTIGVPLTPWMLKVVICISGNARPIPSPSRTGRPRRAAAMKVNKELTPPTSYAISASADFPMNRSRCSSAQSCSRPFGSFSSEMTGAPMPPTAMTVAESARSLRSINSTSPNSDSARFATNEPT